MKRQLVALAAGCLSLACLASEVRYYSEEQIPTELEIATLLAAPADLSSVTSAHGGRTRGVRILDFQASPHRIDPPAQAVSSAVTAATAFEPQRPLQVAKLASVGSVALALRFDVDAVRINSHQLAQLDALAAGIKRLPAHAIVTIAGHTDAFGPAIYNIDLSLKRAMAVRAYLVNVHGIPARRLVAMGKGKSEPLNRANPFAPENRRVQVHAEYEVA